MQLLRKPLEGAKWLEKHTLNDHENKGEKYWH